MEMQLICIIVSVFLLTTAAQEHCTNPVPGVNILSFGIDNKEVDWYLKEDKSAWKATIIDFTCDQAKKYTVPYGNNGPVTYDLPDHVYSVSEFPTESYNTTVTIATSSSEAIDVFNTRFGVEAQYLKRIRISAAVEVSVSEVTIKEQSKFLSIVTSTVTTRKVQLYSENKLPAGLELATRAAQLPVLDTSSTAADLSLYKGLFDKYGMAYLCQANLGGMYVSIMTTDSTYLYKKNVKEVKAQVNAYFSTRVLKVGVSSETGTSNTVVDKAFEESTTVTTRKIGGSASQDLDYKSWVGTVATNPLPISGALCPIIDLIEDGAVQRSMEMAITHYGLLASLNDILDYLKTLKTAWDGGLQKLEELLVNVTDLTSSQTLLTLDRTKPVMDKFDFEVKTPQWFKAIKLCFDWYPDGSADQCTAESGQHLCAVPSELTPAYVDNTYGSSGGCNMKWGLESPDNKHDPWFSQVKVCYKWTAGEGTDAGQCRKDSSSGLESEEVCAPVGQKTADYRDTTDGRPGGCLMSWKLELPPTAPAWSENLRICLRWKATGDGGQCGGSGLANDVCAQVGRWTESYFDNTDARKGGCEMRWSIRTSPLVAESKPGASSSGNAVSFSWAFFFAAYMIAYFAN